MTLDEIEKVYDSASEEYKFFGKDQQLATWAMMHGTKLINIAKAAKYMADRSDLHYLHAEIKDPLLQNIKLKLEELEKE